VTTVDNANTNGMGGFIYSNNELMDIDISIDIQVDTVTNGVFYFEGIDTVTLDTGDYTSLSSDADIGAFMHSIDQTGIDDDADTFDDPNTLDLTISNAVIDCLGASFADQETVINSMTGS
jgi:hypothetical protein